MAKVPWKFFVEHPGSDKRPPSYHVGCKIDFSNLRDIYALLEWLRACYGRKSVQETYSDTDGYILEVEGRTFLQGETIAFDVEPSSGVVLARVGPYKHQEGVQCGAVDLAVSGNMLLGYVIYVNGWPEVADRAVLYYYYTKAAKVNHGTSNDQ